MKTIALFQTLLLAAAITPSAGALTAQPVSLTHVHPQFGPLGSMGAAKLLQQFHLPASPIELFQFLLEYFLKQKVGNTLPLNLDANQAYPTVENAQLPGAPFQGKPVAPTARNFHTALAPGDYVVPVMAYCTQYSVHRAGQGTAYKLAPVEGTQAEAISTLLWRGTLAGKSPQDLQATNWAIQAGVTYGSMPKPYQTLIDQLIPDYRDKLKGNMLDIVQATYKDVTTDPRKFLQSYIKEKYNTTVPLMILPKIAVPAPPLEVVLARMGPAGQMVLDARKQSTILLTAYTTKELGEQILFQGQGEQLPPQPAGEGPWTVRVPGQAYMRFIVKSGNMHGDNLMQIRILANTQAAAVDAADSKPHIMLAGYQAAPALSPTPSGVPATSVYGLLGVKTIADSTSSSGVQALTSTGVIGYSVGGGGAQALVPVVAPTSGATPGSKLKILMADQDVTGKTESVVLGQPINLTATYDDSNDVDTRGWTIAGKNVGSYSYSAASATAGRTDLTGDTVHFYWTEEGNQRVVSFTYKSAEKTETASATFNVIGPTGISAPRNKSAGMQIWFMNTIDSQFTDQSVGWWSMLGTEILPGMSRTYHAASSPESSYEWWQFILDDKSSSLAEVVCAVDGGQLPYNKPNAPLSDKPGKLLTGQESTRDFKAQTFLMWTSNIQGSIPVSLGAVTWGYRDDVVHTGNALVLGGWKYKSQTFDPGSFVAQFGLPQWAQGTCPQLAP